MPAGPPLQQTPKAVASIRNNTSRKQAAASGRKARNRAKAVNPTALTGKALRQSVAKAKSTKPRPRPQPPRKQPGTFSIVAVGASAGGLEAFTELLQALPPDTGMAFVLVQHLDPRHPSQLTELLARTTTMPVAEVVDGMQLEPNHVYVIPPNTRLAVSKGTLKLTRRGAQARPIAIDFFCETLAREQGHRAIGVVLSGTGSDGTLGLKAIKVEGGITFAQDEQSAQFAGMPHSAIAAGVVDFVLPPVEIAHELARLGQHPYVNHIDWPPGEASQRPSLHDSEAPRREIVALLKTASGVDLSSYKQSTLQRRIHRRMVLARIDTLKDYASYLRQNPPEVSALYHDIFIHVTSFFREAGNYEVLQRKVFPQLLKRKAPEAPIRMWVAGCSTGEEAYSLAIAWLEFANEKARATPIQIFATDISPAVIEKARAGRFPEGIEDSVSPERLRRFFIKGSAGYQIGKAVRDLCVFAPHHLVQDPPFTQLDLISCCNVLIYLEPDAQKSLIPLFHHALKPEGFLALGRSESVGKFTDLFGLLTKKGNVYARKAAVGRPPYSLVPPGAWQRHPGAAPLPPREPVATSDHAWDMSREADRVALAQYAPASVIVRRNLEIVQFRGHVGPFLEPAPGQPSHNLVRMARPGLEAALPALIHKARRTSGVARQVGLRVKYNGQDRLVNVEAIPLPAGPGSKEELFLVSFTEATGPVPGGPKATRPAKLARGKASDAARRLARLETDLAEARESLRAVIGERETDNEELTAALEELQSGNEELQSTNEELQSAKEELQSANEELATLNEELEVRSREATQALSDLSNLTDSVRIPMVLVSSDLRLRFFTPVVDRVLNVVASDLGRPISEVKTRLNVPELGSLIARVTDGQRPHEQEVQDQDGRWYVMRLRPYQGVDHKADGAAITWLEITALKTHQAQLAEARDFSAAVVETVREPLLVLDGELRIQMANRAFYDVFRLTPAEVQNRLLYELDNRQWDIPQLREQLGQILPQNTQINDFEVEGTFSRLGRRSMVLSARRIPGADHRGALILLAVEDITEEKRTRANEQILATVGAELALSDGEDSRLAQLPQLLVPYAADWCLIELVEASESLHPPAAAHADPAKLALLQTLARRYANGPSVREVLRTGRPGVYPEVADRRLEMLAQDTEHLALLRELGLKSMLVIPLTTRGRVIGTITLVRTTAERAYTPADVSLAEALAVRIGLALDNARLYYASQRLSAELDERVRQRTSELEAANLRLTNEAAEREKIGARLEQTHDELRVLAAHQENVREEERKRMAHDIHDELGQALTGLKMELARLRRGIKEPPQSVLDQLQALSGQVDAIIATVRQVAQELRPAVLDDLGLLAAIEWLLQEFQKRSGLGCQLINRLDEISLSPISAIAIFRVLQEVLTNIARHAQATEVVVRLEEQEGILLLEVHDNGRGITAQEAAGKRSLGQLGMRERVRPFGGTVEVHGAPGEGTTVSVKIPLSKTQ
jgi:two-component system, chemotaxis family, CheB/CheR fusion protein